MTSIHLNDDGTSGEISSLEFHDPAVHRLLAAAESDGAGVERARDALSLGARAYEMAAGGAHTGSIDEALRRSDERCSQLLTELNDGYAELTQRSLDSLAEALAAADGPLATVLHQLDPHSDDNLIAAINDAILRTARNAMKDSSEAFDDRMHKVEKTVNEVMGEMKAFLAAQDARAAEAERGTRKGLEFEDRVEALLGDLVSVTRDGLHDVSTEYGVDGNREGDHVIDVVGGCPIAVEEKASGSYTERKAREILTGAMSNRAAPLGILIVDDEQKVPGKQPFHFIGDDMVVVSADPAALRLVFPFMRMRSLRLAQEARRGDSDQAVECLKVLEVALSDAKSKLAVITSVRKSHTEAFKGIESARQGVDELESSLQEVFQRCSDEIEAVLDAEDGGDTSSLAA